MLKRFTPMVMLLCASLLLLGCPPGGNNGTSDAGQDVAGDTDEVSFEVELGKSGAQGNYEEFSDSPELEVVSGFQGGFHVEPALRVTQLDKNEFFAIVNYSIVDADSGDTVNQIPARYRVDQSAFERKGGAWMRPYDRVILNSISAEDAAGRTVEITVEFEIEGMGTAQASTTVELVNDIDELGG